MPNDMDAYAAQREPESTVALPDASPAIPSAAPLAPAAPAAAPAQEPANPGNAEPSANDPAAAPDPNAKPAPDSNAVRQARYRRSVQGRIDELTRVAKDKDRQIEALLDIARKGVPAAAPEAGQQGRAAKPSGPPREEDYPGDYRGYLRADAEYVANERVAAWEAKQAEKADATRQETESRQVAERAGAVLNDFSRRTEQFANETPDYDTAIEALDAVEVGPHNAPMLHTLLLHPQSAKLMHYFAKNVEVVQRISQLPHGMQGAAVGEVAAFLSTRRVAPQVSNAPEPGRPVGSGRSPVTATAPLGSMDSYAAWRERQA